MSEAAMLERHSDLIRFEHAAGTAFGHDDEPAATPARLRNAPAIIALATFAAGIAASLSYFI